MVEAPREEPPPYFFVDAYLPSPCGSRAGDEGLARTLSIFDGFARDEFAREFISRGFLPCCTYAEVFMLTPAPQAKIHEPA